MLLHEHFRLANAFVNAAGDRQEISQSETQIRVVEFGTQALFQEISRVEILPLPHQNRGALDGRDNRRARYPK